MCRRLLTMVRRLVQLLQTGASGSELANSLTIKSNRGGGALVHQFGTPPGMQIRCGGASAKFPSHKMLYRACRKFMHQRTNKRFIHIKQWTCLFMLACTSPHQLHQTAHYPEIHGAPPPPVAMP